MLRREMCAAGAGPSQSGLRQHDRWIHDRRPGWHAEDDHPHGVHHLHAGLEHAGVPPGDSPSLCPAMPCCRGMQAHPAAMPRDCIHRVGACVSWHAENDRSHGIHHLHAGLEHAGVPPGMVIRFCLVSVHRPAMPCCKRLKAPPMQPPLSRVCVGNWCIHPLIESRPRARHLVSPDLHAGECKWLHAS